METKYAGYMGKVMMVDLSTETVSEYLLINGNSGNKRSKLTDGDTVVLMSPVAGG